MSEYFGLKAGINWEGGSTFFGPYTTLEEAQAKKRELVEKYGEREPPLRAWYKFYVMIDIDENVDT